MRFHHVLAAAILLSASAFAHADDLFTLTDGTNTVSFTLPSAGVPSYETSYGFGFQDVPIDVDGSEAIGQVYFNFLQVGGGVGVEGPFLPILDQEGPQLFTASPDSGAAIDFVPGTYELTRNYPGEFNGSFDLTIAAVAATPEPSGIALLGTGLLGVAGLVRRRRERA